METISCLICGSEKNIVILSGTDRLFPKIDGRFVLARCTACGFYFQNPRPALDEIGRFYPSTSYYSYQMLKDIDDQGHGWRKSIKRYIKEAVITRCFGYPSSNNRAKNSFDPISLAWPVLFRQTVKEKLFTYKPMVPFCRDGRMLEIGCGSGQTLSWYQRHGWDVRGIEMSETAVENAAHLGLDVRTGTIEEANFNSEYFDAILLFDTIEHMHNLRATLREVRRVLKPSGRMYITTQNIASLEMNLFKGNWPALDLPRHLYNFNRKSLNRILEQENFNVVKSSFSVAPASILDCLRYLHADHVRQSKNHKAAIILVIIFGCRLLYPLLTPFIRILPWFGISGGLSVIAQARRNSDHIS